MHTGIQIEFPTGYKAFAPDTTYYLLANRPEHTNVSLAWFSKPASEWRVHLVQMPRPEFEEAIGNRSIVMAKDQVTMPPWLAAYEGLSADAIDDSRPSAVKSHRDRAQERLLSISIFLNDDFERSFDLSRCPEKLFKRRLRESLNPLAEEAVPPSSNTASEDTKKKTPKPNALRALLWYCVFRLFGRDVNALLPAYIGIGLWSRIDLEPKCGRFGRPTKRPELGQGHSAVGIAKRIQDSYAKICALGLSMVEIHRRALRQEFGCSYEKLPNGAMRPFHPEGLPFPSYQQYRYWVLKEFGLEQTQRTRLGDSGFRTRKAAHAGSFSSDSANYLETAEADVYQIPERPRLIVGKDAELPLRVCRIVDNATGFITGVGFSLGSETAEAYRLAKFCSVVPRELMGRLFGIELNDEIWPGRGLAAREIVDRGPGSSPMADGSGDAPSPIRELSPSWSGQSKATVESSHPRNIKVDGAPSHVVSDLNVFQMAVRELMRTPAENERKDASRRLTPEMLASGVPANPKAIANYLLSRFRTSAVAVSTDTAIRKFLRPVEFELKSTGLWLDILQFSHTHLIEHGLPSRTPKNQRTVVRGYVYPLSLYLAWVEIGGRLHEVSPLLRIRDDSSQLFITLDDLGALSELMLEARARQREHGASAMGAAEANFFARFGVAWSASERRPGAAKKRINAPPIPTASKKPISSKNP